MLVSNSLGKTKGALPCLIIKKSPKKKGKSCLIIGGTHVPDATGTSPLKFSIKRKKRCSATCVTLQREILHSGSLQGESSRAGAHTPALCIYGEYFLLIHLIGIGADNLLDALAEDAASTAKANEVFFRIFVHVYEVVDKLTKARRRRATKRNCFHLTTL